MNLSRANGTYLVVDRKNERLEVNEIDEKRTFSRLGFFFTVGIFPLHDVTYSRLDFSLRAGAGSGAAAASHSRMMEPPNCMWGYKNLYQSRPEFVPVTSDFFRWWEVRGGAGGAAAAAPEPAPPPKKAIKREEVKSQA